METPDEQTLTAAQDKRSPLCKYIEKTSNSGWRRKWRKDSGGGGNSAGKEGVRKARKRPSWLKKTCVQKPTVFPLWESVLGSQGHDPGSQPLPLGSQSMDVSVYTVSDINTHVIPLGSNASKLVSQRKYLLTVNICSLEESSAGDVAFSLITFLLTHRQVSVKPRGLGNQANLHTAETHRFVFIQSRR